MRKGGWKSIISWHSAHYRENSIGNSESAPKTMLELMSGIMRNHDSRDIKNSPWRTPQKQRNRLEIRIFWISAFFFYIKRKSANVFFPNLCVFLLYIKNNLEMMFCFFESRRFLFDIKTRIWKWRFVFRISAFLFYIKTEFWKWVFFVVFFRISAFSSFYF